MSDMTQYGKMMVLKRPKTPEIKGNIWILWVQSSQKLIGGGGGKRDFRLVFGGSWEMLLAVLP